MSSPDLLDAVRMRFPDLQIQAGPATHTAFWRLGTVDLPALGEFLRDQATPHFDLLLDLNLVDDRLEYQLVSRSARQRLRLSVPGMPPPTSLAFVWPAANWLESQLTAHHGLSFVGHPQPGVPFVPTQVADTMVVWAGDRLPTSITGLRIDLELEGATVRRAMPRLGYRHCGIERRLCEHPYDRGGALLACLDAAAPMHADLAYALAVEALLGIEVPLRAQYIRVIAAELTRVAAHLRWLSGIVQAIDGPARAWVARAEQIFDALLRPINDRPVRPDLVIPGGLRNDPGDGLARALHARSDELAELPVVLERALYREVDLLKRLSGIGVLDPGTALGLGLTGPCLRASGIGYDVRRAFPYAGYAELEFDMPVIQNGDAEARLKIRLDEIRVSLHLLRQLESRLNQTSGQPVNAFTPGACPTVVPAGAVYVGVESPRGELGLYLVADGTSYPAYVAVRGPSLANLSALPLIGSGLSVAQVALVLDSLDVSIGEAER